VGALILGEAAVNAGFVGAPTIIVIATAGISGLLVPALTEVISLLRLFFLIGASVFGLYGIMLLGTGLLIHLASLRSFTISYMSPIFPIIWKDWKDVFIRMPLSSMNLRPKSLQPSDQVRQNENQYPGTKNKK
jgi:spore germination protein KA